MKRRPEALQRTPTAEFMNALGLWILPEVTCGNYYDCILHFVTINASEIIANSHDYCRVRMLKKVKSEK